MKGNEMIKLVGPDARSGRGRAQSHEQAKGRRESWTGTVAHPSSCLHGARKIIINHSNRCGGQLEVAMELESNLART